MVRCSLYVPCQCRNSALSGNKTAMSLTCSHQYAPGVLYDRVLTFKINTNNTANDQSVIDGQISHGSQRPNFIVLVPILLKEDITKSFGAGAVVY